MKARLENWSITTLSPYLPPEAGLCFQGYVYDHPRFDDGTFIHTSFIKEWCIDGIKSFTGTIYVLGEVDPEYEKAYPDALNRLKKAMEIHNAK